MKNVYICILLLVVLGGCMISPLGYDSSPDNGEFGQGRRYYLRECGRCHGLIYPEERKEDEWRDILARKKGKVSLTVDQFELLVKFLLTNAGS